MWQCAGHGKAAEEREKDDRAFARAKAADTEEAYLAYLSEFPDGRHAEEARRLLEAVRAREDDAAFARAKAAGTAAAYEAYLSQYPDDRHVAEAKRRREVARKAEERKKAAAPAEVEKALGLTQGQKKLVQHGLASKGYEIGKVDGVLGRRTRSAIRSYQRKKGLVETGFLTAEVSQALQALGKRHVEKVRAALKPGRRFRDCDGTWCLEMVVVPAGSFMMGSPESEEGRDDDEGPRHRVRLAKPFAVGVNEVTRGEFGRFVRETRHSTGNGCWTVEDGEWEERSGRNWRNPGYSQTDAHPVACVSWEDAQAYASWLSTETGERYRLLSEAEWEYVARAGTETSRYSGDGESDQCRHANGGDRALKRHYGDWKWSTSSCDDGHVHTSPVGGYTKNGFGLHDVLGNVWEWVADCSNEGYTGAPSNGSAWERGECSRRVLRGGSWNNKPQNLRSANRNRNPAGNRNNNAGFRVASTARGLNPLAHGRAERARAVQGRS